MHDQLHPPSGKILFRYGTQARQIATKLYIAIVANASGCTHKLFWLINAHDFSLLMTYWSFFPPPLAYAYAYIVDL